MTQRDNILGSLLGEALGDSIGLWCEGMSSRRQQRFGPYRQQFFFGKGMYSDDTEHVLMNLWEWPCGAAWIERVAARLAESVEHHQPLAAVSTNVPLLALRNGLFAFIVLTHGFRRLLPPYG